jgi:cytochrome c oxidase subunit 4
VLLVLTVEVARHDMGSMNFAMATLIATVKAVLIILFFMHVKQSLPLTKLVVCAGFFWLLIMFSLTFTDYWTRGWLLLTSG